MTFLRVRTTLALIAAFVMITSGSTAVNAAPDALRGGGQAIVRIDAQNIKVKKIAPNQYRITLPTSAKGQWLGTRKAKSGKNTQMVGELSARDLVNGWSSLGYKKGSKVAVTIKWKPAGAKVRIIPAQITQAKKLDDGRTTFDVTSAFALPSQLTQASVNLARASGPALRSYPVNVDFVLTDDVMVRSQVQGDAGPANEALQSISKGTTCYSTSLSSTNNSSTTQVSCNGTDFSGTWQFFSASAASPGYVSFDGTISVNNNGNIEYMDFSAAVVTWGSSGASCATGGTCVGGNTVPGTLLN